MLARRPLFLIRLLALLVTTVSLSSTNYFKGGHDDLASPFKVSGPRAPLERPS
jgi:hypothetical protein